MKKRDRRFNIARNIIFTLLILIAGAMMMLPLFFEGLRLYVLEVGGGMLILNLLFVFYFFRRNSTQVDKNRRIR